MCVSFCVGGVIVVTLWDSAAQGRQVHGVDLTEGARLTPSLRFADGQKLVRKRKCMELELFYPDLQENLK